MSGHSTIEWTDATWNPVTGCTRVSEGCGLARFEGDLTGGCYAESFAERFRGVPGHHFEHGFDLTLRPERLDVPLRWRKPRRIFVNSMSDLFHVDVPDEFIVDVFARMWWAPQHTFQVLTKRHARMRTFVPRIEAALRRRERDLGLADRPMPLTWPLPNVWLGVSVETQQWADIRVPELLRTPAAVRFLSCEPLLGPVDLSRWLDPAAGLHWVIAGGESESGGTHARPMDPAWARALRDQCQAADLPFHFKQWGQWRPTRFGQGTLTNPRETYIGGADERGFRQVMQSVGKHAAGRDLDGRTWDQYPPDRKGT